MSKLIVALDINDLSQALELIDILSPQVEFFKIGSVPYVNFGDELLRKLESLHKKVFLDLKTHDIPNTVQGAARAAIKKGVYMMTFHCLGGLKMLKAAVEGVKEVDVSEKPLLLGITVLTSMTVEDMRSVGLSADSVEEEVIKLATLAKEAGLDGVVASAKETKIIKEKVGQDFVVVTPGIRPLWSAEAGDQARIVTPAQAALAGSDYIVVGRPILQAEDPLEAASKIIEELDTQN